MERGYAPSEGPAECGGGGSLHDLIVLPFSMGVTAQAEAAHAATRRLGDVAEVMYHTTIVIKR